MKIASVLDYRKAAQKRLPRHFFDYVDGGAFDEITIQENRSDLKNIRLKKRVMQDVTQVDTSLNLWGQTLALPLILAPVGFMGLHSRRGEVQAAKAAEQAHVPFCLSTLSICSMEEVAQSTHAPFWFQLYMLKDRGICRLLIEQAQQMKCSALVLTVDLPRIGIRYRDVRSTTFLSKWEQVWQFIVHPRWLWDVAIQGRPLTLGNFSFLPPVMQDLNKTRQWIASQLDAGLTWKDLEWVRSIWKGPLIVKGILDKEDAKAAVEHGADAIVVSNHAGRHIDCVPTAITVLPYIVETVPNEFPVFIDGGIFNGLDILKAQALGARACLIGRAWAYALAARGEAGVLDVIKKLQNELKVAMAHVGVKNLQQINSSLIFS